jgi:hypothetical protein
MSYDMELEDRKYKRFLELCNKSVKLSDLKQGFICYSHYNKYEITSEPYINDSTYSLVIDCNTEYDTFTIEDDFFCLQDNNIVNGGYNLCRLFANKKDAEEYHEIIKTYQDYVRTREWYGEIKSKLKYKIKPIPGETLDVKNSNFPIRKITRFN